MPPMSAFLLVALSVIAVKATNINGDPTDITNWPQCAQNCIPIGLNAPTSCGSLSNLTCICQTAAFSLAIADCETTTCSTEELQQISALSYPLCAPVGGQPASVTSAVSSALVTASLFNATVASYPATATGNSAVSAILATATPTPGAGNPADILTYPKCAQICANESVAFAPGDVNNVNIACGPTYRSVTAACEQLVCNFVDRAATQDLAQRLCGPVYKSTPSLGSAVTSAIASATAVAASLASKDPTDPLSYPLCAQTCQNQTIPVVSDCGTLSNRTCVCKSPSILNSDLSACEVANCSTSDLRITEDLADALCNPVGGIGNVTNPPSNQSFGGVSKPIPSSPIAFTGEAIAAMKLSLGWIALGLFGVLGWQVIL